MKFLQQTELEIRKPALQMIQDSFNFNRFIADSVFTKGLVKALKTQGSFYYPFDSLITVSRLYAPDSTFRIFTWQIERDPGHFRQRGAIQMNTKDGSLKLFPLFDGSDYSLNPNDSIRTFSNWIGAIYYGGIIKKTHNNKSYYTLLGYDDNDELTTKKWIEILTFAEDGTPRFGGRIFMYKQDILKPKQPVARFPLEFKKQGRARLTYDPEMDMIIFEHLISETNRPEDKYTLIPDGDYEGFRWVNGQWVHVEKVFDYQIDMRGVDPTIGNAPLPMPIRDKSGKLFEELEEEKANQPKPKEKTKKKKQ